MDKFRVGQKVRIIKTKYHPELLGLIVVITERRALRKNLQTGDEWLGYGINLPSFYVNDVPTYISPIEESLEPVYDGDEKKSWSECAWKPKELTVK